MRIRLKLTYLSVLTCALGATGLSGCGVGNALGAMDCYSDADCPESDICHRGACVSLESELASDPNTVNEGDDDTADVIGCDDDSDCNPNQGSVCVSGVCVDQQNAPALGQACNTTAECPLEKFCNPETWVCEALRPGACRVEAHCSEEAPICSAQSQSVAGTCLECLAHDECETWETCNFGFCEGEPPPDAGPESGNTETETDCPPNTEEVASGVCVCLEGYVGDGMGNCVEGDSGAVTGSGESFCPEYSSPDPAGGCICDDGYVVNAMGTGCEEDGSVVTPPPGCPENSHEIGPGQCVCDDGYEANDDYTGCVPVGGGGGSGGTGGGSCYASCGGQSLDGDCWCDFGCLTLGDCCADYDAQCGF